MTDAATALGIDLSQFPKEGMPAPVIHDRTESPSGGGAASALGLDLSQFPKSAEPHEDQSTWRGVARNVGAGLANAGAGMLNVASDPFGNLVGKPFVTMGMAAHDALAPVFGYERFPPDFRNAMLSDTVPQPGDRLVSGIANVTGLPGPDTVVPQGDAERLARKATTGAAMLAAGGPGAALAGGTGAVVGDLAASQAPDWAKPVAELAGNVAGGAAPGIASAGMRAVGRPIVGAVQRAAPIALNSSREASVGRTLDRVVGGSPVETSPVGPLNLAQATNNPEVAARVDIAPSFNAGAKSSLDSKQQQAIQDQIGKIGEPATKADASSSFTNSLRQGREIAGSEENRLWNVPELAQTKITPDPVKASVKSAIATIDPVLRSGMSPELKSLVNRLDEAKTTTLQDLNGIRSDIERIARNPMTDGGQRSMARTISGAFLDGLDKVPEIAGSPEIVAQPPASGMPATTEAPAALPSVSIKGTNRAPDTLHDWLIANGGVKDESGELAAADLGGIHHRGGGRLVNPNGMTHDAAREGAVEAGFLPPNADLNDFRTAVQSQQPVYRISEAADAANRANQSRQGGLESHAMFNATGDVQNMAQQMGARLTSAEVQKAAQLVAAGEHPEAAIHQAVWPSQDAALQQNAQISSFTNPGMPGATQAPLPVPLASRPAIQANPAIASAYQSARDYTRQMRSMFAAPDPAALLAKNASGIPRVDQSEGAGRFFNFSNGSPEGPRSISQLSDFIDTLKAHPMAGAAAKQMRESARSYVAAALTDAARANEGQNFNAATMQTFLRKNSPWMKSSGLFEQPQIEAATDLMNYAEMLRRPDQLLRQSNSMTQPRAARSATFIDSIMAPWVRHLVALTSTLGGMHQHGPIGAGIGMLAGGAFEKAVTGAETSMRTLMADALMNPELAQSLRMKAGGGNRMLMPTASRRAIDAARNGVVAGISEAQRPQQTNAQGDRQ